MGKESVRCKYYPNYINKYTYIEGSTSINLKRINGGKVVYNTNFYFDSIKEAEVYFLTECGA